MSATHSTLVGGSGSGHGKGYYNLVTRGVSVARTNITRILELIRTAGKIRLLGWTFGKAPQRLELAGAWLALGWRALLLGADLNANDHQRLFGKH